MFSSWINGMGVAIKEYCSVNEFFDGNGACGQRDLAFRNSQFHRHRPRYQIPGRAANLHACALNRYRAERTGNRRSLWLAVDGMISRDDGSDLMAARLCVNDSGMATTGDGQQHASKRGQAF